MSEPRSTRDALIAEMLGDVGRLHDELGSLRNALPAMADDIETRLSVVFGSAVKTAESLKAQCAALVSQTEASATQTMERKATQLTEHFVRSIGTAAQDAANTHVAGPIKNATHDLVEAAGYIKGSATVFKRVGFKIFSLALVAGFLGSLLAVAVVTKFHLGESQPLTKEQVESINRDQRLVQIWGELSQSTKDDITRHYNTQSN